MKTTNRYHSNGNEQSLATSDKLTEFENSYINDPLILKKRRDEELALARELASKQYNFLSRFTQTKHDKEIVAIHQNNIKESLDLALKSETKNMEVIEAVRHNITKEFGNSLQKAVRSTMKGNVNAAFMLNSTLLFKKLETLNSDFLNLMEEKLADFDKRHPKLHDMIEDQFQTAKSKWMDQYEAVLEEFTQLLGDMVQ